MTAFIKNKRGSAPTTTAIAVLIFALLISVFMFVAFVQIQTVELRNAMKTGLANLAVKISDDTNAALRESDFEEYAAKLTSRSSYRQALEDKFCEDVMESLPLESSSYDVTAIRLDFDRDGMKLRYICTCDVAFQVSVVGINLPAVARSVQVEGSHTAKYGR